MINGLLVPCIFNSYASEGIGKARETVINSVCQRWSGPLHVRAIPGWTPNH